MSFMSIDKPTKVTHIDADAIAEELKDMVKNSGLKTEASLDDDNKRISFIEKHTLYLAEHPKVNPQLYLANLRTMIKIRV